MSTRSPALLLVLALLAVAAPSPAAAACRGENRIPGPETVKRARLATLCLLNAERRSHGMPRLREHARLRRAAKRHSRAMVRQRFFSHVSPSGSSMVTRVTDAGYRRWASLGENIAWGGGRLATPASIVQGWMRSSGHRENILNPGFREIGIGIARGTPTDSGGATYTTNFGVRR